MLGVIDGGFADRIVIDTLRIPAVPWQNGGGMTREVAIWPPGSVYADFDWRLSVADVVDSGTFSSLPGVDRHFLMGTGGSLLMTIDGQPRQMTMGMDAIFPGEAEVRVEVQKGPTRNLNLMMRRGRCSGTIDLQRLHGQLLVVAGHGPTAVVVLSGTARLDDGTALGPFHVLIPGRNEELIHAQGALVAVVQVWRHLRA